MVVQIGGLSLVNGCRQHATAQNSGKAASFFEWSLFIFFSISFIYLLNKLHFQNKRNLGPDGFSAEFYKPLKKKIIPILQKRFYFILLFILFI